MYILVPDEKIKTDKVINIKRQEKPAASMSRLSEISIAKIIQNIKNEEIIKLMPDNLLTSEQKKMKYTALAKTVEHINNRNDSDYKKCLEKGDLRNAYRMILSAAKKWGAITNSKEKPMVVYHGTRHAFNDFSKEKRGSYTGTKVSENWFFAADKETANSYYPYGALEYLYNNTGSELFRRVFRVIFYRRKKFF